MCAVVFDRRDTVPALSFSTAVNKDKQPGLLKRLAPGEFELEIAHHDFALIVLEP